MEESRPTDAVILQNVIKALKATRKGFTIKVFREALGYKSDWTIFRITKGAKNQEPEPMSANLIQRILEVYPEVNSIYLRQGRGPVLRTGDEMLSQSNMLDLSGEKKFGPVTLEDLQVLPRRLDALERDILDIKQMMHQILHHVKKEESAK